MFGCLAAAVILWTLAATAWAQAYEPSCHADDGKVATSSFEPKSILQADGCSPWAEDRWNSDGLLVEHYDLPAQVELDRIPEISGRHPHLVAVQNAPINHEALDILGESGDLANNRGHAIRWSGRILVGCPDLEPTCHDEGAGNCSLVEKQYHPENSSWVIKYTRSVEMSESLRFDIPGPSVLRIHMVDGLANFFHGHFRVDGQIDLSGGWDEPWRGPLDVPVRGSTRIEWLTNENIVYPVPGGFMFEVMPAPGAEECLPEGGSLVAFHLGFSGSVALSIDGELLAKSAVAVDRTTTTGANPSNSTEAPLTPSTSTTAAVHSTSGGPVSSSRSTSSTSTATTAAAVEGSSSSGSTSTSTASEMLGEVPLASTITSSSTTTSTRTSSMSSAAENTSTSTSTATMLEFFDAASSGSSTASATSSTTATTTTPAVAVSTSSSSTSTNTEDQSSEVLPTISSTSSSTSTGLTTAGQVSEPATTPVTATSTTTSSTTAVEVHSSSSSTSTTTETDPLVFEGVATISSTSLSSTTPETTSSTTTSTATALEEKSSSVSSTSTTTETAPLVFEEVGTASSTSLSSTSSSPKVTTSTSSTATTTENHSSSSSSTSSTTMTDPLVFEEVGTASSTSVTSTSSGITASTSTTSTTTAVSEASSTTSTTTETDGLVFEEVATASSTTKSSPTTAGTTSSTTTSTTTAEEKASSKSSTTSTTTITDPLVFEELATASSTSMSSTSSGATSSTSSTTSTTTTLAEKASSSSSTSTTTNTDPLVFEEVAAGLSSTTATSTTARSTSSTTTSTTTTEEKASSSSSTSSTTQTDALVFEEVGAASSTTVSSSTTSSSTKTSSAPGGSTSSTTSTTTEDVDSIRRLNFVAAQSTSSTTSTVTTAGADLGSSSSTSTTTFTDFAFDFGSSSTSTSTGEDAEEPSTPPFSRTLTVEVKLENGWHSLSLLLWMQAPVDGSVTLSRSTPGSEADASPWPCGSMRPLSRHPSASGFVPTAASSADGDFTSVWVESYPYPESSRFTRYSDEVSGLPAVMSQGQVKTVEDCPPPIQGVNHTGRCARHYLHLPNGPVFSPPRPTLLRWYAGLETSALQSFVEVFAEPPQSSLTGYTGLAANISVQLEAGVFPLQLALELGETATAAAAVGVRTSATSLPQLQTCGLLREVVYDWEVHRNHIYAVGQKVSLATDPDDASVRRIGLYQVDPQVDYSGLSWQEALGRIWDNIGVQLDLSEDGGPPAAHANPSRWLSRYGPPAGVRWSGKLLIESPGFYRFVVSVPNCTASMTIDGSMINSTLGGIELSSAAHPIFIQIACNPSDLLTPSEIVLAYSGPDTGDIIQVIPCAALLRSEQGYLNGLTLEAYELPEGYLLTGTVPPFALVTAGLLPAYVTVDAQVFHPDDSSIQRIVQLSRYQHYMARWTGALLIHNAGHYTFLLHSADGTVLRLGGREVVDNDGFHPQEASTTSEEIWLDRGLHPLQLLFWKGEAGPQSAILAYAGPDTAGTAVVVPRGALQRCGLAMELFTVSWHESFSDLRFLATSTINVDSLTELFSNVSWFQSVPPHRCSNTLGTGGRLFGSVDRERNKKSQVWRARPVNTHEFMEPLAGGVRWSGALVVKTAGNFSFRLTAPWKSGSLFLLDGRSVFGELQTPTSVAAEVRSGEMALSKGLHSLFLQAWTPLLGADRLMLEYRGPDTHGEWMLVPCEALQTHHCPRCGLTAQFFHFPPSAFQGETSPSVAGQQSVIRRVDEKVLYPWTAEAWPGTQRHENFVARWSGGLRISSPGWYKFFISGEDRNPYFGSSLVVNTTTVIQRGQQFAADEYSNPEAEEYNCNCSSFSCCTADLWEESAEDCLIVSEYGGRQNVPGHYTFYYYIYYDAEIAAGNIKTSIPPGNSSTARLQESHALTSTLTGEVFLEPGLHVLQLAFWKKALPKNFYDHYDGEAGMVFAYSGPDTRYQQIVVPSGVLQNCGLSAHFYYLDAERTASVNMPNLFGEMPDVVRVDDNINYEETTEAWTGLKQAHHFAARWAGQLVILTGGWYQFTLTSDDGSIMTIGTQEVFNDGVHEMLAASAWIYLTSGEHDLRIEYWQQASSSGLTLAYNGPDTGRKLMVVPCEALVPAHSQPTHSNNNSSDASTCQDDYDWLQTILPAVLGIDGSDSFVTRILCETMVAILGTNMSEPCTADLGDLCKSRGHSECSKVAEGLTLMSGPCCATCSEIINGVDYDEGPGDRKAREGLESFLDGLGYPDYWKENTSNNTCNSWPGIVCTEGLYVDMRIKLSGALRERANYISRDISLMERGHIRLTHIDLSNNLLTGSVPMEMGDMRNLVELNLASNTLEGEVPNTLNNLWQLQRLDLSHNNFEGTLPPLWQLPLQELRIANNSLSGTLRETEFVTWKYLEVLDFSQNQFQGPLPRIPNSATLELVNGSHNQLSSVTGLLPGFAVTSPHAYGGLRLDLSHNKLTAWPEPWKVMSTVISVDLSHNLLSGLPAWARSRFSDCSANTADFSEEDSAEVSWPKLERVHLTGNPLSAEVSQLLRFLSNAPHIKILDCAECELYGPIDNSSAYYCQSGGRRLQERTRAYEEIEYVDLAGNEGIDCPGGLISYSEGSITCDQCPEYKTLNIPANTTGPFNSYKYCECLDTLVLYGGTVCGCETGYFFRNAPDSEDGTCMECNEGEDCIWSSNASRSLLPPTILEGYWAADVTEVGTFTGHSIFKCASKAVCLGGEQQIECGEGRTGRACGNCIAGYSGDDVSKTCSECLTHTTMKVLFAVVIVLAVPILWTGARLISDEGSRSLSGHMKGVRVQMRIIGKNLQTFNVIGNFSMKFPDVVQSVLDFLLSITISINWNAGCFFDRETVATRMGARWAMPWIFALILILAWIGSKFGPLRWRLRRFQCLTFYFFLWTVFFNVWFADALALLYCEESPNGRRMAKVAPHLECFNDEWWNYAPGIAGALLLHVISYVVALLSFVRHAVLSYAKSGDRGDYAFATEGFRTRTLHWPVYTIIKDIMITICPVAFNDASSQAMVAATVLASYGTMTLIVLPFDTTRANNLEVFSSFATCAFLCFAAGLGFASDIDPSEVFERGKEDPTYKMRGIWLVVVLAIGTIVPLIFLTLEVLWDLDKTTAWFNLPGCMRPKSDEERLEKLLDIMGEMSPEVNAIIMDMDGVELLQIERWLLNTPLALQTFASTKRRRKGVRRVVETMTLDGWLTKANFAAASSSTNGSNERVQRKVLSLTNSRTPSKASNGVSSGSLGLAGDGDNSNQIAGRMSAVMVPEEMDLQDAMTSNPSCPSRKAEVSFEQHGQDSDEPARFRSQEYRPGGVASAQHYLLEDDLMDLEGGCSGNDAIVPEAIPTTVPTVVRLMGADVDIIRAFAATGVESEGCSSTRSHSQLGEAVQPQPSKQSISL